MKNTWAWIIGIVASLSIVGLVFFGGSSRQAYRVARGGAWDYDISQTTIAFRERYSPDTESSDLGFRCVSQ